MELRSCYTVIMTPSVKEASALFVDHLRFEPTFESDWYISLVHRDNPAYELAFLQQDHDSLPEAYRIASSGLLISLEVSDATAEYERLLAAGMPMVQPLRDEDFGQRHFMFSERPEYLVDVIEIIPFSGEFAS